MEVLGLVLSGSRNVGQQVTFSISCLCRSLTTSGGTVLVVLASGGGSAFLHPTYVGHFSDGCSQ